MSKLSKMFVYLEIANWSRWEPIKVTNNKEKELLNYEEYFKNHVPKEYYNGIVSFKYSSSTSEQTRVQENKRQSYISSYNEEQYKNLYKSIEYEKK